ncbi:MAG: NUDIX domain-containing protein [Candidatus Shapirobacteria bacterium]
MDNAQKIYRDNLTYRQSTSAVILDKSGRILIVQKSSYKDNEWDIPGGGIIEGETPRNAIIRELNEELGSDKFEVIKVSEQVDRYEWPDEVINKKIAENKSVYRGQERVQFLVKFLGEEMDLKPQEEEIRNIKWVFLKELSTYLIFPNQTQKMEALLNEFGNEQNTKQMTKPKNGSKVLIMSSDKILLFHRDNIMVPNVKKLRTIPTKINVVN